MEQNASLPWVLFFVEFPYYLAIWGPKWSVRSSLQGWSQVKKWPNSLVDDVYIYNYTEMFTVYKCICTKKGHTTRSISISICHLDIKNINHLRMDMKNKVKPSERKEELVPFHSTALNSECVTSWRIQFLFLQDSLQSEGWESNC